MIPYLKGTFFFSLGNVLNLCCEKKLALTTVKKINILASTILNVLAAVSSIPFFLLGGSLHLIGDLINKPSFYVQKKEDSQVVCAVNKIASWNVCLFDGGLSVPFGGLPLNSERINKVIEQIKENNPDIIALQEVGNSALKELQKNLKDYNIYHSFGSSSFFFSSGIVILSKVPLNNVTYHPFSEGVFMKRGFVTFETDKFLAATTHLQPGENNQLIREKQLKEINNQMAKLTSNKPKVIFGDFNWQRPVNLEGFKDLFSESNKITATNLLKKSTIFGMSNDEPENESIDTFLIDNQNIKIVKEFNIEDEFNLDDVSSSLSDHNLVAIKISS